MLERLYSHRFSIFFISQIVILFGSLLIPSGVFESLILSIFFLINIVAGIVLVSKSKFFLWFFIGLLCILFLNFIFKLEEKKLLFRYIKMGGYFLFYGFVATQLIKQVWLAKIVDRNVIFGLISGYISLGLIGFFICLAIEISNPGSFEGLKVMVSNTDALTEQLMYFSYITLLTIGYGDILPVTTLAQKATILIGLMGQMYLVVITAIVVGKYINQSVVTNKKD
ncbi:hypothetical protein CXF68_11570 [Tenacibaculum sp. Bg11-29]|uniref:ion channel n=1 Tax=Tenacibaculum sp. Bg11-29 TaxID=2058306 RepID=UPI000C31E309|nr:ion channel [Tenacibaculum sp. Bg11-29]PKH51279.1 hypothetical protein CXF68_11570 [Tenacibaculum sp. Bg11-29]